MSSMCGNLHVDLEINVLLFRNDCCVYNGTMAPVDTEVDYISPDYGCTHVNILKMSFVLLFSESSD